MRKTLIALLLTLVIPAAAHADQVIDPSINPEAVAIAEAQWPDSQCNGYEVVHIGNVGVDHPDPDLLPGDIEAGYATWINGACDVEIDPSFVIYPYDTCRILSHEFGHLATHNAQHILGDPSNIMSAVVPAEYAPCDPLKPAPLSAPAQTPQMASSAALVPTPVVTRVAHKTTHKAKAKPRKRIRRKH